MRHGLLLFVALLFAGPAFADPPTDASLEELFKVTDAQNMFAAVNKQMDNLIQNNVRQASNGQDLTPEKKAIIDRMAQRMSEVVKETVSWENLKPLLVTTYKESFSQDDIKAMLKFYKTPAGQNMLKKMPLVMQNMMSQMQPLMRPMQEKMQQIAAQAQEELKQLKSDKSG